MPQPAVCTSVTPEGTTRPIFIDTHCHTFNGADLPVEGFILRAVLGIHGGVVERLVKPLVRLIGRLADVSKSADDEKTQINAMLLERQSSAPAGFVTRPGFGLEIPTSEAELVPGSSLESMPNLSDLLAEAADDPLAAEPGDGPFTQQLEVALAELEASDDPADQDLYEALHREVASESVDEAAFAGPLTPVALAAGLLTVGGTLARYIRWARLMTRFRFRIIQRLMSTYAERNGCVDLFTPAQVDLSLWLEDDPNTSLARQVDLLSKTLPLFEGRLHPLVAFDPWRESLDPGATDGPLARVQRAIEHQGFVGVKVYPPMGFSALQNEEHDFTLLPHVPTREASRAFGKGLDDALRALYEWCEREGVPVMAHAEATLGSRPRWEFRAHPNFWRLVIDKFSDLRINLAHFGGTENLVAGGHHNLWTQAIGRLMEDSDNVYSDFGHFSEIDNAEHRREIFEGLERFLRKYPAAEDRLMFGTDWVLLAKERGAQRYFQVFADELSNRFGPTVTHKILGGNAVNYLGIGPGEPNRLRLERYWAQNNIQTPSWTRRL